MVNEDVVEEMAVVSTTSIPSAASVGPSAPSVVPSAPTLHGGSGANAAAANAGVVVASHSYVSFPIASSAITGEDELWAIFTIKLIVKYSNCIMRMNKTIFSMIKNYPSSYQTSVFLHFCDS